MTSLRAKIIRGLIRIYTYPLRRDHRSLSRSVKFKDKPYVPPKGISFHAEIHGGVRVEVFSSCGGADGAIIFFHGGGHTAGMNSMYRRAAKIFCVMCRKTVYCIDYKPRKDYTFPSLHAICYNAYKPLAGQLKKDFVAIGDSFGAGLMLYCCLKAKEDGVSLPDRIIHISPFIDMSASGDSYKINCHRDPLYALPANQSFSDYENAIRRISPYCGDTPVTDRYLSPVFAELYGMPEMLIVFGEYETSASDGEMLFHNALKYDVKAEMFSFSGMWHDFMYMFPSLKESKRAFKMCADFLGGKL